MHLGFLIQQAEFVEPKKYSGQHELLMAGIGCCLWFVAIVVRLGFSSEPWTLVEKLIEATSFVVFAALPAFCLATPQGDQFARKVLLPQRGLWFQLLTCGLLAGYFVSVKILVPSPTRLAGIDRLTDLIFQNQFWLNTGLFLLGTFVILRIPFLLLEYRDRPTPAPRNPIVAIQQNPELVLLLVLNWIYISLVQTSLVSIQFKSESSGYFLGLIYVVLACLMHLPMMQRRNSQRLKGFDLLLVAACLCSLFWFSRPNLSFGVFLSLALFIVVLIHGTGLGREHFGYSFQVRQKDWKYVVKVLAIAVVILVPLSWLSRFTNASPISQIEGFWSRIAFFLSYAVLFSFRVGIFEEVLFRAGLMVLIRDWLQTQFRSLRNPAKILLLSAGICSILFGIAHIGNDPGANSPLSPFLYKTTYAVLATLASLFYSITFGATNRLWGSIVIHGIVDTSAVLLLGVSLTVPF